MGGRLKCVDPATDRLEVGALVRLLGSLTFEDGDVRPISLAELAKYRLPRKNAVVIGLINSINTVYTLPFGDKAIVEATGVTIEVKYNGQDLLDGVGNDVLLSESGGGGTGFDTITFINFAPVAGDRVTTSYYKET
jgi:hypothetical protein